MLPYNSVVPTTKRKFANKGYVNSRIEIQIIGPCCNIFGQSKTDDVATPGANRRRALFCPLSEVSACRKLIH